MNYFILRKLKLEGTSLYNDKKKESIKLLNKKEEKVNEIYDLLKREIEPTMEKLKKEK